MNGLGFRAVGNLWSVVLLSITGLCDLFLGCFSRIRA